jgi:hypothetical protein
MDHIATANAMYMRESSFQSMTISLYARTLVNRDLTQTTRNYAPGYNEEIPGLEQAD